jgi:retron-type reverse transcriptase
MDRTPMRELISRKQAEIAMRAKQMPNTALRTLAHHIDLDWLREAHRRTRTDGAPGSDGVTADDYAQDLEGNLLDLHQRLRMGTYRAPPVKRAHIPKDNGKTRPIGIPAFEDKIVQRAVGMLLEPIYEQDFYPFSYGFRPRMSPHDAVSALREGMMEMKGGWVLDVDFQNFFDDIDHQQLRELLGLRIADQQLANLWR